MRKEVKTIVSLLISLNESGQFDQGWQVCGMYVITSPPILKTDIPMPLSAASRCNLRFLLNTVSRQQFHHKWLMRADLFAIPGLNNPLDTFLIPNSSGFSF